MLIIITQDYWSSWCTLVQLFLFSWKGYQSQAIGKFPCYSFLELENKFLFPTEDHQNFSNKFFNYCCHQYKNSKNEMYDSIKIFFFWDFASNETETKEQDREKRITFLNQSILNVYVKEPNPSQRASSFTIYCFKAKSPLGFTQVFSNFRYFLRVPYTVVFIWRLNSLDFHRFLQRIMLFQKSKELWTLLLERKNVNTAHMKE